MGDGAVGPLIAFTGGLTILTGLIFGLAPALQASNPAVQTALKEGGRTTAGNGKRLQQFLVAGEIALALVLLIGAGLIAPGTKPPTMRITEKGRIALEKLG